MVFNWILINKFAVGTPILSDENKRLLKKEGIKSILDLRNKEDLKLINHEKYIKNLSDFHYRNLPLPDHNSKRLAETHEISNTLVLLNDLLKKGPVFMHCHAATERSPLISIAYLQVFKGLTSIQAYDFVKQQNCQTNVDIRQVNKISLTQ